MGHTRSGTKMRGVRAGRISLAAGILFLNGCYTVKQGYQQLKLIMSREPLDEVLAEGKEPAERLQKLAAVPDILAFAKNEIGLTPGNSYHHYISLPDRYVSWVVQAAEKRALALKTWWFPIVGSQPYLGFFQKADAENFRTSLVEDGYDTTLGGVQAFSLLGYFPDPIYSSMLDNNSFAELVEVLIHESLHRTIYVPNHSAFNENLADFVARRATVKLFEKSTRYREDMSAYWEKYERNLKAQAHFKEFLTATRKRLEKFYSETTRDPRYADNEVFLEARGRLFDEIADNYLTHMSGTQTGTSYEWAFRKGAINNAVILGYSLYEAGQRPFEIALQRADNDLKLMIQRLQTCLKNPPASESDLWDKVENCR